MNTVNNEGFLTSSVNTSVNVVFLPGQFYDTGNGATSCFFFFFAIFMFLNPNYVQRAYCTTKALFMEASDVKCQQF